MNKGKSLKCADRGYSLNRDFSVILLMDLCMWDFTYKLCNCCIEKGDLALNVGVAIVVKGAAWMDGWMHGEMDG